MTTSAHTPHLTPSEPAATRAVAYRTRGQSHGPITRLMSPGDVGALTKPFVFLDYFETASFGGTGFGAHPHSGIATHTTLLDGATTYGDATGKSGVLTAGDLEWMQAGGGVWHWGSPQPGATRGYQLWVALPAALELAPAESLYVHAGLVETDGAARILMGRYGTLQSAIAPPFPITYLHVRLADGERWTYSPPEGHDVAWLAVHTGRLQTAGVVLERELAVFDEGHGAIALVAEGATELIIGSAAKHPHPLVLGSYSVHTSRGTLELGEANIAEIGRRPDILAVRRST